MAKEFEYIKSKVVNDTDGFLDDYTMYKRLSDGKYIMIFGDTDMYTPENTEPDAEFDTQREADEWFNSYGEDESIDPEDLGLIDNISFDDVTKESKGKKLSDNKSLKEDKIEGKFSDMAGQIGLRTCKELEDFLEREGYAGALETLKSIMLDYLTYELDDLDFIAQDESLKEDYQDDSIFREDRMSEVESLGSTSLYTMYLKRLNNFKNDKDELKSDLEEINKYGYKFMEPAEVEDLKNKFNFYINKLSEQDEDDEYDDLELDEEVPKSCTIHCTDGDISLSEKKKEAKSVEEALNEGYKDFVFTVKCNDGPKEVIRVVAKDKSEAEEYAKKMYAQNHTTYADDRHNVWSIEEFVGKGINESYGNNESVIRYPNGMEVTDVDLDRALDYQYGTDRDMDNSKYTDEEKQRAVTYWINKTDPNPYHTTYADDRHNKWSIEDGNCLDEAMDSSKFDKLLDKAFEFGYNYGYSDTFEDFMKKVKPNVKQSLTKDMLIRLKDAFDNGNHEGDVDEEMPLTKDESLKESSNDDKLRKINILYRDAINHGISSSKLDKILIKNGADPSAKTFDVGLKVDSAYEELTNYLRKIYKVKGLSNTPYNSYEILGLEDYFKDESLKESYQNVDSMSREELMDEIDGIYYWALKGKHIDITSIIEDPEVFNSDDSDDEEGYFKGVPTDKLRGILKILRKMLSGGSLTHDDVKFMVSKDGSVNESNSKSRGKYVRKTLSEDTIQKKNGKWTNRGKDGQEHGEFDTKEEADAQRKAMFARGFKG